MKIMKHLAICVFFAVLLISCSTTKNSSIYDRLDLYDTNKQVFKDPYASIKDYRTFTIIPYSEVGGDIQINKIAEKQILFYVRNLFELKGYKFVNLNKEPDFIVSLFAKSPYKESYIPPSITYLPTWVPGSTTTTRTSNSGNIFLNIYGDDVTSVYGNYDTSSREVTSTSDKVVIQPYTVPGKTVGYYYPTISIWVYDYETAELVWKGEAVGSTNQSDIRISSQLLLRNVIGEFPSSNFVSTPSENGITGILLLMYTLDGNNYYPTVVKVVENSPADKAGIKVGDVILRVDGKSTQNILTKKVLSMITGRPNTNVTFQIWREGIDHAIEVTIERAKRNLILKRNK